MERRLPAESIPLFNEGIALVLYRWSALRAAVENEWGGRDSRQKAEQLGTDLLSWFTLSKEPLYIDDLENMLDEGMLSLNVEVDDGSVEEYNVKSADYSLDGFHLFLWVIDEMPADGISVAEKLMLMHEECLEGNFKSIEILREAGLKQVAGSHVTQVVNDDDDDSSDDGEDRVMEDENPSNMMVDMSKAESNLNSVDMPVNGPIPKVAAEADDGWVVVSNRRNKGRKN
ncbi:pre-rRNA-processing protein TSR2-like protein [Senna tora]|uniref:Pre-rRNA-processing protein TSR2-like protein n=1 Tax=Senna tora TaxID=362788 RepID=A0A834WFW8_9FABA|nr:pre-rRNA-processing protein TSR2-like protein [Senna tora]